MLAEKIDTRALRGRIGGEVFAAGDEGWDEARLAFNLTIDQRPALIAQPASAAEVAEVVRFAREAGLRVAPQRTGHNAGPLGSLERTLLLKTNRLDGVQIEAAGRRARTGAGARWEDVVPTASELGLAALHGSTPDVSVAGYSLGGGMGWYARKHGLACNSITALEVVTAEGERICANRSQHPELFWALRGGGGNFGVVTALEFELLPLPEVYAGVLFFGLERAGEVLHAWHEWTATVPDEVTSVGRVLRFPPFPEIPEPLRGNSFAVVEAVFTGAEATGAELLRPLRELGPSMDTFAMVPPAGIAELHMDPREPVPGVTNHTLLDKLPPQAIDDLVEACGAESGSSLLSVELRHTGGALGRPREGNGALAALAGEFASFGVGIAAEPGIAAKSETDLAAVEAALAPYALGGYLNFTEEEAEIGSFFDDDAVARLRAVKRAYDPDALFQANHQIDP